MNVSHRSTQCSARFVNSARLPRLAALALAASSMLFGAAAFAQAQGDGPDRGQGKGLVAPADGKWVPGRVLVQPRPGLSEAEFGKILGPLGARSVGRIEGLDVHIVQLPPQASERAVAALLRGNKHIKFAELDMIFEHDATNDPYYDKAWHLPKIGANTAWSTSTGKGVTIAILDTGVDGSHPDLVGKLVPGWNIYDNNANTSDVHGHGTRVAGTAAAATNNGVGVASVAADALIAPVRISSPTGGATLSNMAAGVRWAADNGARVANISFSGARGSATVQSAAQYMKDKGGLVVVSAGNSGGEEFIARSDTLIVASGTTSSDTLANWSSYGAYVDVAAPGASIYTTSNGGGYNSVSGTSFASPVTAAVVAKMMAANPKLGPDAIQQLLYETAVDLGAPGWDKYFGEGRVDAAAAVKAAAAGASSADTTPPQVAVSNPGEGSTVKGLVAVDVAASDNVGVSRVELLVDGKLFASDTTAPYGFSWDSTKVGDGNVKLSAYAYDAAGNAASHTVTVKVENAVASEPAPAPAPAPSGDTSAPVTTISNPAEGSTVNGNVDVRASATDNVGVVRMRLYLNDSLVASANGNSVRYKWSTRPMASGSHTLRAEADDAAGNTGKTSVTVIRP